LLPKLYVRHILSPVSKPKLLLMSEGMDILPLESIITSRLLSETVLGLSKPPMNAAAT
jgi:hypothetical protein